MNRGITIVEFTLHGGTDFTLPDIVDDDGKFLPLGVDTLKAFKAKRQLIIHVPQPGREATLIIPYHSVMEYSVMKDFDDIPKPVDAFCDTDETAVERTVTLPKIAESNQAYQSDIYFILEQMLPFMINEGIEVKFMDNVVSNITNGTSTEEQVSWNVEDSNGTHVIAASITDDQDVLGYPTVDGEEVDALSFTVGTDKRFGITHDNDEYHTNELCSIGDVITTADFFTKYMAQYPYDPDAEFQPLPEDKTLPVVEDDFKYLLSQE